MSRRDTGLPWQMISFVAIGVLSTVGILLLFRSRPHATAHRVRLYYAFTPIALLALHAAASHWNRYALGAICAVLCGWTLWSHGWGNTFYTAAVKSMSLNYTNLLFSSFDRLVWSQWTNPRSSCGRK